MRHRITRGLRARKHSAHLRNLEREIRNHKIEAIDNAARADLTTLTVDHWYNWLPRPRTDI